MVYNVLRGKTVLTVRKFGE